MKIQITKRYALLSALIVFGAVIIDFVTKQIIMHNMTEGQSIPLIKNFLHITYITNDGMAFGALDNARWIFMTASAVMILGLTALLMLWDDRHPLFYISASMVLGGGIGNMIDRTFYGDVLFQGEVVDFIDFRGIWQYIFNGADSFVCVGAGLLALYFILSEVKAYKTKKSSEQEGKKE